jgi:hypothetical protein
MEKEGADLAQIGFGPKGRYIIINLLEIKKSSLVLNGLIPKERLLLVLKHEDAHAIFDNLPKNIQDEILISLSNEPLLKSTETFSLFSREWSSDYFFRSSSPSQVDNKFFDYQNLEGLKISDGIGFPIEIKDSQMGESLLSMGEKKYVSGRRYYDEFLATLAQSKGLSLNPVGSPQEKAVKLFEGFSKETKDLIQNHMLSSQSDFTEFLLN